VSSGLVTGFARTPNQWGLLLLWFLADLH